MRKTLIKGLKIILFVGTLAFMCVPAPLQTYRDQRQSDPQKWNY